MIDSSVAFSRVHNVNPRIKFFIWFLMQDWEVVMSKVLVTGGSGFIGSHVILQLLAAGHNVRTTVRSLSREREVRAMLREGGADPADRLSFVAADLLNDAGWAEAVAGCDYVVHVASPLPPSVPKNEDELIVPAREGTLRVLRAARDAGVKRVVQTSSFAAIGYGRKEREAIFTEADWTDPNGSDVQAYTKSKTLAERSAWDFIAKEGGGLELSVINPVAIFGPVLGPDFSGSIQIIKALLDGTVPAAPKLYFALVDVRDVADLHLRAMTSPAAKGERFIAVAGETLSILDIAKLLRRKPGASAPRLPRLEAPNWLVRLAATRVPLLRAVAPQLGQIRRLSGAKARTTLGWAPRDNEEIVLAMAESLMRLGLVRGR
jgi:dihydroflavonol-4-reductase